MDSPPSLAESPPPFRAGRRCHLAVLFADLTDSSRLAATRDAEDYAELLHALRRTCREVIGRHGGRIAGLQGDGVLAIFGHPEGREDDGRRATEAALALRDAVKRLAAPSGAGNLALHTGVHAGLVFLSEGDSERGEYDLAGHVTNVAARLSDLANADEILVSEETLGPEAAFFEQGPRETVRLRGHTEALPVLRIIGRAAVQRRFDASQRRGLSPFVGREAESEALHGLLVQVVGVRSGAAALAVAGGPGMGKTRLLERAASEAEVLGAIVLRGYCEATLDAEPMQPFLQMLRVLNAALNAVGVADRDLPDASPPALPGRVRRLDAAAQAALAAAFDLLGVAVEGGDPPVERLRAAFEALATAQPVVLLLDDWQWADSLSQQVLDALLASGRAIAALLATREAAGERLAPETLRTLSLAPLTPAQAARSVGYLLQDADPFVAAEIQRYAGGNPLFIEELCHAARAGGRAAAVSDRQSPTAWLHALIESRIGRLPRAEADVARAAAVIGNVVPAWLLEELTGQAEDSPLLQALAVHDVLFPAGARGLLRFKHGITRDVVYASVGRRERQAMHRRVAFALMQAGAAAGGDDVAELLAYHHAAAGMPAEAAHHAELAGDKAIATHALDRARAQYAAALAALDELPLDDPEAQLRWCGLSWKLGMACVYDPLALSDAVALFERGVALARRAGKPEALALSTYWLTYICYAKGLAREAVRHGRDALELAVRLGDLRLAAQVRATLGQALATAGQNDEALQLLDSAIDSKRARARPGGSVAVGSAYSLACKASVLGGRGEFEAAEACCLEALELLGGSLHQVGSSVRSWVSVVYQWQGRWAEAALMAAESQRVAEHVKSRQLLAMARMLWGHAQWVATGDAQALQVVRDATAWIDARSGRLAISLNLGWLVEGAVAEGNEAEARRHAARLFACARAGDRLGEAVGCRALARSAGLRGDARRAAHHLAHAMRSAERRGAPHEVALTQLCRAEIALDAGNPALAREPLEHAVAAFERMRMRWHLDRAVAFMQRL